MNADLLRKYSAINSDVLSPDFSLNDIREYLGPDNKFKLLKSVKSCFDTALQFCNVAKGDIVIVQSIGLKSGLEAVLELGAIPILVDSEAVNWNISALTIEVVINNCVLLHGVRPKAIVMKHYMGVPAFMDEICAVAHRHQIPIIEDCVGAFGSYFKGKACGTMGQYAVFSVCGHQKQNLGLGLLVHRVPKFDAFLDRHLEHEQKEYKGDMPTSDFLPEFNNMVKRRREIYERYSNEFKGVDGIELYKNKYSYIAPSYAYASAIVTTSNPVACREKIIEEIAKKGYDGYCIFPPSLNSLPQFSQISFYGCRVGSKICTNGIILPTQADLSNDDIDIIAQIVKNVIKQF